MRGLAVIFLCTFLTGLVEGLRGGGRVFGATALLAKKDSYGPSAGYTKKSSEESSVSAAGPSKKGFGPSAGNSAPARAPSGAAGAAATATTASEKKPPVPKAAAAGKVDKSGAEWALLFDCDGVIVETEELHRQAYNAAFSKFGLKLPNGQPVEWTVEYYDVLQNTVGGGKPKMMHYFNKEVKMWPVVNAPAYCAPPETDEERTKLVDQLQDAKTEAYIQLAKNSTPRPGVVALMDAALANPKLRVGICSAATKEGFVPLVNNLLGKERLDKLDVLIVGDDVKKKKPDPMIYNTARERLGLKKEQCIVVEDSLVGLRAAVGAGMPCIVTYTASTRGEAFYKEGAAAKVPDLSNVTLDDIFPPLWAGAKELLVGKKDVADFVAQGGDHGAAKTEKAGTPFFAGWTPHMATGKK